MTMWQIPWWEDPEHRRQVQLRLVALGGHTWDLAEWSLSGPGLGLATLVVDADAQRIVKGMNRRWGTDMDGQRTHFRTCNL